MIISSFSKYQVATSSVLTEITQLVLMWCQWAWHKKILIAANTMKCIFWHLSCILEDLHAEENQFSSFRLGLELNYNELKGLIDLYSSWIFLFILVSGSRAQLSFSTDNLSPTALGASLRAVQLSQILLRAIFQRTGADTLIRAWEVLMWNIISSFDLFLHQRLKDL